MTYNPDLAALRRQHDALAFDASISSEAAAERAELGEAIRLLETTTPPSPPIMILAAGVPPVDFEENDLTDFDRTVSE